MDTRTTWIVIAVVVIAVAALAAWWLRRERSARLRRRFGPEYEREVQKVGNVSRAEATLEKRADRVASLDIRPLPPDRARSYAASWRDIQTRFVDYPQEAVREADRLVGEVMHERGYPIGDFEQQVADISVDHPGVVMHYRAARDIIERSHGGRISTEDLRQAMVHYRALFEDLLGVSAHTPVVDKQQPVRR